MRVLLLNGGTGAAAIGRMPAAMQAAPGPGLAPALARRLEAP